MPKLVKKKPVPKQTVKQAVWAGPESPEANGGITQSMISQFLCCRERFRLRVIKGLAEKPAFNHRIEYGSMWHVCEEAFAKSGNPIVSNPVVQPSWAQSLKSYCQGLCKKYPMSQAQIQHWYNVCKTQFPIYVDHWKKHDKKCKRTPLLQEQVFHVPYRLPSSRVVWLRGKWDSVDLEGKKEIWLQENKSKGDINEQQLQKQLLFDLQTMIYLIALQEDMKERDGDTYLNRKIAGTRYNVIRRPLSGGKGSIVRHKAKGNKPEETEEAFYARLAEVIKEQPENFFMRWKVNVTQNDIERFKHEFLNPCLEHICDWWNHVSIQRVDPFGEYAMYHEAPLVYYHYRLPYGIYSTIAEGGSTPVDEYLENGSMIGLQEGQPLFQELEE